MEIDITEFFNEAAPMDYSASVAEIGRDAGRATWQAALDDSEEFNLLDTEEKQEAARAYFKTFGAWTAEELAAFTAEQLNALLLQFIAGDIREHSDAGPDAWDWGEYLTSAENSSNSGRLFKADDGRIFFYMGY